MKIVTDTAADLPAEEAQRLNISVAPLFIQFPEGEVNSNEITPDQFYQRLAAMQPNIPSTAQPSEKIFSDLYEKVAQKGEEILSIHISSGLSGTINAARLAARQMSDRLVHIVDTMTLSGAERFQVLAAASAVQQGWNVQQIMRRLEEVREKTEIIYTLETLKYLAKGGRIGRVQALAGSLLNIKPIIHVEHSDGKYSTVGKARTVRKSIEDMVDHLAAMYKDEKPVWVSVMHGNFAEPAEDMARLMRQKLNVGKLEVLRISPVLGVHTGPGIVGAAVAPQHLLEDFSSGA